MQQWRREGHSILDIAAWTGRDKKTVLKYIKHLPAPRRPVQVCRPIARVLLELGLRPSEVAKAMGASRPVISQIRKRMNRDS